MELFILCIKVFFGRIFDVSLGTIRTIMTVKGKKIYATTIGFFEVFIWFITVREALNTNVSSLWIAFSYALGYATGTFIGSTIAEKFIKGTLSIQVITSSKNDKLVNELRNIGYAVSVINAKGKDNKEKYMLYMEINKKNLSEIKDFIKNIDENAFIVVSETKLVQNGFIK